MRRPIATSNTTAAPGNVARMTRRLEGHRPVPAPQSFFLHPDSIKQDEHQANDDHLWVELHGVDPARSWDAGGDDEVDDPAGW